MPYHPARFRFLYNFPKFGKCGRLSAPLPAPLLPSRSAGRARAPGGSLRDSVASGLPCAAMYSPLLSNLASFRYLVRQP